METSSYLWMRIDNCLRGRCICVDVETICGKYIGLEGFEHQNVCYHALVEGWCVSISVPHFLEADTEVDLGTIYFVQVAQLQDLYSTNTLFPSTLIILTTLSLLSSIFDSVSTLPALCFEASGLNLWHRLKASASQL